MRAVVRPVLERAAPDRRRHRMKCDGAPQSAGSARACATLLKTESTSRPPASIVLKVMVEGTADFVQVIMDAV